MQGGRIPYICLTVLPVILFVSALYMYVYRGTTVFVSYIPERDGNIHSDAVQHFKRQNSSVPVYLKSTQHAAENSALLESITSQYTINPYPCDILPIKPSLVIIVTGRVTGFELRQAIRATWGSLASPVCGVRLLFMVGATNNATYQDRLTTEGAMYGDLIQSNQFDDTYSTAAAKSLHLLQWSATFCSQSVYTVKIDDDNWLNLPKYSKFLLENSNSGYAFGAIFPAGGQVIRDPWHKNFVSREDFNEDIYPEYMSGMLYAFPTKVLPKILMASREIKPILNEDVYVCGLLAGRANVTRKAAPDYGWTPVFTDTKCPKRDKTCIHYSRIDDFYKLWNDPCDRYRELC